VDACAFRLVEGRAGEAAPAEGGLRATWRSWQIRAEPCGVLAEVDGENGELTVDIRAEVALLAADAEIAVRVGDDGCAEHLAPVGSGDGEWGDDDGAHAVRAGFCNEGVEEGWGGESEEGLAVEEAARRADGAVPVRDGEGVLDLGGGLSVASKEAGQQAVGLRGESIDGEGPAAGGRELMGALADPVAAGRTGDGECSGPGMVVDALVDEDAPRGV